MAQSDEDEQVAYVSRSLAKGRGKVEPKHPEPKCFGYGEQGHFIRTGSDKKSVQVAVGEDIALHIVETKVDNIMQVRHHVAPEMYTRYQVAKKR